MISEHTAPEFFAVHNKPSYPKRRLGHALPKCSQNIDLITSVMVNSFKFLSCDYGFIDLSA